MSAWPTALWPVSPENLSPSSACSARGDVIARRLVDKVKELGVEAQYGSIDISLYRDDIFKLEARPSLRSSNLPFSTDDMRVVLVDDVLYTGRTIRAALNALFRLRPSGPY
ncbi:hypothetical protein M5E88_01065 [Akkermansia muciniphila]|nr:hypothetical protein M5E88_01065 [Akkermansia muciniphila]